MIVDKRTLPPEPARARDSIVVAASEIHGLVVELTVILNPATQVSVRILRSSSELRDHWMRGVYGHSYRSEPYGPRVVFPKVVKQKYLQRVRGLFIEYRLGPPPLAIYNRLPRVKTWQTIVTATVSMSVLSGLRVALV